MITQKDIDDLVFNFKWSKESFKNKRVTDIYRQGILDVVELLKKKEQMEVAKPETPEEKAEVEERQGPILQRLDRIYDLLLHKLNEKIIINNPYPRLTETPYKFGEIWCDSASASTEKKNEP